ncbi:hypothetical protein [Marinobacter alexandrii]|uniref:hypothetical protein n=1 Tax=Marinobacter alexandrii TaxID=2570351 RepID=UPI003299355A
MSFFSELKRRNVVRAGVTYVVFSWLVIQVAETLFPLFDLDDSLVRLLVIIFAVGFIPALVCAWILELTPDGFRLDSGSSISAAIAPKTSRKTDSLIMLALALALSIFSYDKFVLDPKRDEHLVEATASELRADGLANSVEGESIAVLPFSDMSQYGDQGYLSDGFAEELMSNLAKMNGLRVASRTSSFSLRNEGLSAVQMAQRLNVSHILEGSIRLAGNQLRVTVQLIDARLDTYVWSENYDRVFDDIFTIQDDIAAQVADVLEVKLFAGTTQNESINPEAHNLYLQAAYLFRKTDPDDCASIIDLLTRAVAIDPGYFDAWFMLGDIYQRQVIWEVAPKEPSLQLSYEANRKAAEIRPESARVYRRMGWMALRWDEDLEQAAVYIQKAIGLTENPIAKVSIAAALLRQLGRTELLVKLSEHSAAKNPTIAQVHWELAQRYIDDGQYVNAIGSAKTALTLSPGIDGGNGYLAYALYMNGDYQAALDAASKEELDEMRLPISAMALDALDRHADAQLVLQEMRESSRVSQVSFAEFYARRGDVNEAFSALESLSPEADEIDWRLLENPMLTSLHEDIRWQAVVDEVNAVSPKPDHVRLEVPVPEEWH